MSTFETRQLLENLVPVHIREIEIQDHNVVIVKLTEIDALLAEVRRIDVKALGRKHHLDAARCRLIVLN